MGSNILAPFLGMLILTAIVWFYMYVQRLSAISGEDPQKFATPEGLTGLPPAAVNPSNNLKNLFELPVLFYAVVLLLIATDHVDSNYVYAAWGFLVFRTLHSVIHCTYNKVVHRFAFYALAAVCLWYMVVRAAAQLI